MGGRHTTVKQCAKYKQLSLNSDSDKEIIIEETKGNWSNAYAQKSILSLGLILLYFSLSIGLTFYQRWLLKDFHYPLTVVLYHLIIKWILSVFVRTILQFIMGTPQLVLPFMTCMRSVGPTGVVSGVDVGFSNWGLELVTVSLYTMTKSTTIVFILGFAILLGLEKKSWSLVGIVVTIAAGLLMFTYKATQFNILGFYLLLLASFAAGLRWSFAQLLMQKSKLGLHNPVDMVFHVQPWMILSLLPFAIMFEGLSCYDYLLSLPPNELMTTALKIFVGATIAFAMEISEFLVVTYTSSLTLSIAGIFKEICILILAVKVSGDQLSAINVVGLALCMLGIIGHIIHKVLMMQMVIGTAKTLKEDDFNELNKKRYLNDACEHKVPLLGDRKWQSGDGEHSDLDAKSIINEVLMRRDGK